MKAGGTASADGRSAVATHLLGEDRAEYEQVLDETLSSAPHRPELNALGQRLNAEQLRTMALKAAPLITAAAASEYEHYVKLREQLHGAEPSRPSSAHETSARETAGAGAAAVLAVLVPVLAGTSAAIFLLVGYILKMLNSESALTRTLITTGWLFVAVTAVSVLAAAVGLLLTALRNSPAPPPDEFGEEVARARDAWREALRERGIMPFLRAELADPGSAAAPHRTSPSTPAGRTPGFTGPKFPSPDYSSPDFGGPEHRPE
ncbi:hypothetical protein [Streptomyces hawaiiensis]|uniref:hypothetical protein n=1 Tax=Streptomyces hawaiiensis TaxID=67305 RepID=UPI0036612A41